MTDDAETRLRRHIAATPLGDTPEEMRRGFHARIDPAPEPAVDWDRAGGGLVVGEGPRTVMWFHGGGYVFGSPETHAPAARRLAAAGLTVILPRYPLAPEHPWPAARDAAVAALDAVEDPVTLVGDSAGGHLALNVALARPGRAAALALISPNTDRTGRSRTRKANEDADAMNDDAGDGALARMAFPGRPDAAPEVSPLLADLGALPRLWIAASTNEVLLDDSLLLARAAARAGVAVDLTVARGLFHMWPLWPDRLPAAGATLDALAAWISRPPAPAPDSAGPA
ncbi:alpha/beta hydrolase [Rhodobacteraceae bacterium CCMM004]|nr:alpha/beta hydrolase [Rhodobacteraceae bacterium CCMM004]